MEVKIAIRERVEVAVSLGGSTAPILVMPIVELTQAEYDAMQTPDPDTLYGIPEEVT